MAAAFGLTLAHLGEAFTPEQTSNAFAAYITGNATSNLIGRLMAAAVVDYAGLSANFFVFAALNLCGAALAYFAVRATSSSAFLQNSNMAIAGAWSDHLRQPEFRAAFAIGFCILFAFIGTFTYVNFVLVAPPLAVDMMSLGLLYFVFLPSIVTTLLAGPVVRHIGHRTALQAGLGTALIGLPMLLIPNLPLILLGMTLVAIGTFFAQALVTGFVGRAAKHSRAAASGLYLASYFAGGLVGSAVLGQLFDRYGWAACVAGVGAALLIAAVLSLRLIVRTE